MENSFSNWQLFLDQQLDKLYKSIDLLNKFKRLKSNYERIEFVNFFSELIDNFLNSINFCDDQKSDKLSEDYRKKGNNFYTKKDNLNALNNYNLALLYAPLNSKSLYLAYSNRSAVFYDLEMAEKCLDDVGSCEYHILQLDKNTNSNNLFNFLLKLVKRKLNCLIKLKQNENFPSFSESKIFKLLIKTATELNKESELVEINQLIDQYDKTSKEKYDDTIKNEQKYSKNFLNNSVDVQFSIKKGRHCLAKQDIKTGEVLFTEKAYCSVLLPMASLKYCDFCFKYLYDEQKIGFDFLNIHPCTNCSSVFYCSESCRILSQTEGKNYHIYECGFVKKMLHNLGLAHLAYRILNSTDQELIIKYSTIQKMADYETNMMNIDYRKDSTENDYCQVFYLLTHENTTHLDDLFKYSLTALLLAKIYTKVLKNECGEFLKMVSSLILRHLLQCICNAHAITQLQDDSNTQQTFSRDQYRYGSAIYPRVSLLNHSCKSNVVSSFKENSNIIVVKASRSIKKHEEIFNSYGPHFIKMTYFERKQSLSGQYHFDCDCSECEDQSRIFTECKLTGLKCLFCTGSRVFSTGKPAQSNDLYLECFDCKNKINLLEYSSKFDSVNSVLSSLDTEFENEKNTKMVIKKLQELVTSCQRYLCINRDLEIDNGIEIDPNIRIYYLDFSKLIDTIARLNCNLNNLVSGCLLLEKNIKILEIVYGSKENEVNIELGHELFKLSEVQCMIKEFGKAFDSINRAIMIGECVYSRESAVLNEYYQVKNYIKSFLINK